MGENVLQKTCFATTPEELDKLVNDFSGKNNVKASQVKAVVIDDKIYLVETVWFEVARSGSSTFLQPAQPKWTPMGEEKKVWMQCARCNKFVLVSKYGNHCVCGGTEMIAPVREEMVK